MKKGTKISLIVFVVLAVGSIGYWIVKKLLKKGQEA